VALGPADVLFLRPFDGRAMLEAERVELLEQGGTSLGVDEDEAP
jgi:hypothetical protein